jgi:integrase
MAHVIQRVWKSGPRNVRKVAWGYTLQLAGKQERKFNAAWSRQDAERELAQAQLGLAPPKATPSCMTLGAMVKEYLATREARGKKTIRNDRYATSRLLVFFGADTPLDAIAPQRVAQYERERLTEISVRLGRPVGPASLNRDLSILRGMLRLAVEWECLAKAPRIRLTKEPEGRLTFLDEPAATRLLADCQRAATHQVVTCRSPHLYAIVTVALNTGMRRGEILGLTWERVDFARGVVLLGGDEERPAPRRSP